MKTCRRGVGLLVVAISTTLISMADAQCDRAFNIDFRDAILTTNTLHLQGGELRLENLGSYLGRDVDLVVTVVPGTIYSTTAPDLNGRSGLFGQINVENRPNDPSLDGVGEFDFCFRDNASGDTVDIESFDFTFFDLDGRGDRGFEKLTMDVKQYSEFQLSGASSEVEVQCESTTNPPPCNENENICFISTTTGGAGDNPNNPDDLTLEQQRRSVLFTFRDTSCFRVTFGQLCNDPGCSVGGNLVFAGTASQLADCDPTLDPTRAPAVDPTRAPVPDPTPAPTRNPTPAPLPAPTKPPDPSPTRAPIPDPTRSPTLNPTIEPTPAPQPNPTGSPNMTPKPTSPGSTAFPTEIPPRSSNASKKSKASGKGKSSGKGDNVKGSKKEKRSKSAKKMQSKLKKSEDTTSEDDLEEPIVDSEDMMQVVVKVEGSKSSKDFKDSSTTIDNDNEEEDEAPDMPLHSTYSSKEKTRKTDTRKMFSSHHQTRKLLSYRARKLLSYRGV